MAWFKMHEECPTDPKLAVVARRSGQNVATVLAIWCMLLSQASAAEERGDISSFDCEAADVVLGLPDGVACTVFECMKMKGLITEDNWIANWQKRQGSVRRSSTSTDGAVNPNTQRVREYRARQRAQREMLHETHETHETSMKHDETGCNADETQVKRNETQCNADETHETLHETHETPIDRKIDKIERKKEREKDRKTEDSCAERNARGVSSSPQNADNVQAIAISLPLVTGEEYPIPQTEAEQWQELYPAVSVMQALRSMRGWLLGNPKNRKTPNGILRFVHAWLRREQDRAPASKTTQTETTVSPHASPPATVLPGLPSATTEYQYQQQQRRVVAASLLQQRENDRQGGGHAYAG